MYELIFIYAQTTWKYRFQQDEKHPYSRHKAVGLVIYIHGWIVCRKCRSNFLSNPRFYNEEDGCFSSCLAGAQVESQCRVAYTDVGKGREQERKLYNSYEGLVIHCELCLALTFYLNSEAYISR